MNSNISINGNGRKANAHVIVCGNEKGGSGKTTTTMHIVVALLKTGFKVATVDLDTRQCSLSRYVENRRNWSKSAGLDLELSNHFKFDRSMLDSANDSDSEDFASFAKILGEIEQSHDFVVIDTPGSDSYLMRLAHSMADTLITPLNDSFVDFDVLGKVDPKTNEIYEVSHYATMVREARRQRRTADNGMLDWIVIRNRLSTLSSRNQINLLSSIKELSIRLGFRLADGFSERVIFREYFPMGLTALDDLDIDTLGTKPTLSHLAARQEIRQLLSTLRLPIDDRGKKRAAARRVWFKTEHKPVAMPDIFAD